MAYLSNLNICLSRYEHQNRSIFLVASILVSLQQEDQSNCFNFWRQLRLYCVQGRLKPTVSPEELLWHFDPCLFMESTNQEREMLNSFTQKDIQLVKQISQPYCYWPTMQLVTMEAIIGLISVVILVWVSYCIYRKVSVPFFSKFKMASNMAGSLGRKLFCRFLGANRYMLRLS